MQERALHILFYAVKSGFLTSCGGERREGGTDERQRGCEDANEKGQRKVKSGQRGEKHSKQDEGHALGKEKLLVVERGVRRDQGSNKRRQENI